MKCNINYLILARYEELELDEMFREHLAEVWLMIFEHLEF